MTPSEYISGAGNVSTIGTGAFSVMFSMAAYSPEMWESHDGGKTWKSTPSRATEETCERAA
jgi:hypothetical protein